MSLSMYDASATVFSHNLGQLSHFLAKGSAHATEHKLVAAKLLEAKLASDMFPLTRQVQIACDTAKLAVARLTMAEAPSDPDTETTFDQLQARISKTQALVQSVDRAAFEGSEERNVTLKLASGDMQFSGQAYLLHFALPNFFFHLTTAYAILRHNGVALVKADFIGRKP
ncbi:MAG: DUF1993 domain-containing protein [Variovorax sp.]